jgi:hypothetical protein
MTTIEGWEKDKVALMVKRGAVREVRLLLTEYLFKLITTIQIKFPYVSVHHGVVFPPGFYPTLGFGYETKYRLRSRIQSPSLVLAPPTFRLWFEVRAFREGW